MAFLLLIGTLSAALFGQAGFTVTPVGPAVLEIDTRHGSGNRFEFNITNNATALDYITIQRASIRSGGQPVFGVPSPEYGVSLTPGASARMWFRWDLVGRVNPGSYSATVPFKSELNGAVVTQTIQFLVKTPAAEGRRASITGSVKSSDGKPIPTAILTWIDTGVGAEDQTPNLTLSSDGAFSFSLAPGEYALSAYAVGYEFSTVFFRVAEAEAKPISFRLASASSPLDSNRVAATVANVSSSIWTMRASSNASFAATAPMGSQSTSAFHGIKQGTEVWTIPFPGINSSRGGAVSQFQATDCDAVVSADGRLAAGMDYNGRVYLIDTSTGVTRWSTDRAQDRSPLYPANSMLGSGFFTCGAVAFSPDGLHLAAGGSNGWLVMFDAVSGAALWNSSYSAEIRALRFTPDSTKLAVGAGDWKFRMLSAETGSLLWAADNQFWPLFFIAIDAEGSLVASGSKEAEFRMWNAVTGNLVWKKDFPAGAFVSGAAIFQKANKVVVSDWTFGVHAYDLLGNPLWFRRLNNAAFAASADGAFLVAAGYSTSGARTPVVWLLNDQGTVLWEGRPDTTRNCRVQAPFASDFLKSVAVSQEGSLIRVLAACVGGTVFQYELSLTSQQPSISANGVVNAASFTAGLAPGSFASIFGEGFSSKTISAPSPFPTTLGGVTVRIGKNPDAGEQVPLYAISPRQINFLVPSTIATGPNFVIVETSAGRSEPLAIELKTEAPGIFFDAATGLGAVLHAGTALTTAVRAASSGDFLEVYATGLGGGIPKATIAGVPAQVTFSGETAIPGLVQVNLQVPPGVPAGSEPLQLSMASGATSNRVTIRISGN